MSATNDPLMSAAELEAAVRQIGAERYHSLHPFHHMLHGGRCTPGQVQAWVLNRYYYQSRIPLKDAALMSRMEDIRRCAASGRTRIEEHDGSTGNEGGIAPLAGAGRGGRPRPRTMCVPTGVLPATRFAVDAYVRFVRDKYPARSHRLVADRAFRPEDPRGAHRGAAGALRFRQRDHHRLFPHAASARRPRTWTSV